MTITQLRPLLVLALLLPACGTPCEPSVTADTLILVAADECLPQDGSASVSSGDAGSSTSGTTDASATTAEPTSTTSTTGDATTANTSTGETETTRNATSSTSDATTDELTSTGETTGGSSTGEGPLLGCFADECNAEMPCGDNLACKVHPISGVMVCAASDCSVGPCDGNTRGCREAPPGECIKNETNHGWCYPDAGA